MSAGPGIALRHNFVLRRVHVSGPFRPCWTFQVFQPIQLRKALSNRLFRFENFQARRTLRLFVPARGKQPYRVPGVSENTQELRVQV